jgi:hypothetical protein
MRVCFMHLFDPFRSALPDDRLQTFSRRPVVSPALHHVTWKGERTVAGMISLGADVDCPGFAQPPPGYHYPRSPYAFSCLALLGNNR